MSSNLSATRRELTAARLEHLLKGLAPEPSEAAARYTRLCRRLSTYFTWERCADPDRLADEVMDRVARRLADGEVVANLTGYVLGVARNVASEARSRDRREARAAAEFGRSQPADTGEEEAALQCLDRCLDRLDHERRRHVLTYYTANLSARIADRKRLAGELALKPVALRNRMLRLRQRLEYCVAGCLSGGERDGSSQTDTEDDGSIPGGVTG